jgi:glycerophosphoryl diester phosphodiesterase
LRNIAHRGASGYAPENTTAAFDLAIEIHADAIETDVQLTRDGHLVLFHDTRLDRTSNGIGPVGERTLAELRELDLGSWFDTSFAGMRIQTLGEALDTYLDRIPFVLEIKDPAAAIPMMESIPVTDRIEVTSFDWDALIRAKDRESRLRFGFLTSQFDRETIERCIAAGLGQICPHADTVTADLVAEAHSRGLEVRAWGISRRDQIDTLLTTGADGTTCNWPDWLQLGRFL